MIRRGRLVALEGGEGSGKSTQARLLADRLGAVLTREPGGTDLGEAIRNLVLQGPDHVDPRAEALLMAAARAQHVAEVIRPALEAGQHVVTDRFTPSSLAYQGFGRGLGAGEIAELSHWATAGITADLVVFLEVADEVRLERRGAPRDRMEAAGEAFHQRVIAGFRELAAMEENRWEVVAGEGEVSEVAERIWAAWERSLAGVAK